MIGGSKTAFRAASRPEVDQYIETMYTCKQEDNWESLSRKYFLSDRYAEALQEFNRRHPEASDRLKRDGQPVTGDTVFLPSAQKLEKDHGGLLRPDRTPTRPLSGSMPGQTP